MYTLDRYRKIVFGVLCAIVGIACFYLALPLWSAFAWGTVLAILVFPIHLRFRDRFGHTIGAALTTLTTLLFILVPIGLVAIALIAQTRDVAAQLQNSTTDDRPLTIQSLVTDAEALLEPALARLGVGDFDLHSLLEEALDSFSKGVPAALKAGIVGLLNFIFSLLLLFFLLRDGHKLKEPVIELMPVTDEKARSILKVVYDTVHATFFSTVVVALIQGTLLGIAFWVLGLPAPLLWGVAGAILSMIPFMGTPILWVPACILLASRGQWIEAIGLMLFGAFVIGLVDNVLKPVIIGARVKLHTIAVFFAIVGGIVTLGPVGVLVGPVLLSVALGVIEILREMAVQDQPDAAPPA